jgi:3'(2'), 5'-bisphosphate nucleotidase
VTERAALRALAEKLLAAAEKAAEIVMEVYAESDPGVEMKGPADPVTRADREANAFLLERLSRELPGIPIVAEESDPSAYRDFAKSRCAFFVDPVDGTREFVAKNGEFGVMIGYAEEGRAVASAIVCPALGESYLAIVGEGAYLVTKDGRSEVHVSRTTTLEAARCAASRTNRSAEVEERLARMRAGAIIPVGSAALKGARVATGALDLLAHPTSNAMKLWDACAPDALVHAAGGRFTDARGNAFDYRGAVAQGAGMLATNGVLHDEAVRRLAVGS